MNEKPSEEGSPTPRQETRGAYPYLGHEDHMRLLADRIRWLERHRHWYLRDVIRHQAECGWCRRCDGEMAA